MKNATQTSGKVTQSSVTRLELAVSCNGKVDSCSTDAKALKCNSCILGKCEPKCTIGGCSSDCKSTGHPVKEGRLKASANCIPGDPCRLGECMCASKTATAPRLRGLITIIPNTRRLLRGKVNGTIDFTDTNGVQLVKNGKSTLARVLRYENGAIVERIAKDNEVDLKTAHAMFKEALTFLWGCQNGGRRVPNEREDEAWHCFILFMMDYRKFCYKYFGKLIYHRPTRTEDSTAKGNTNSCVCILPGKCGDDCYTP